MEPANGYPHSPATQRHGTSLRKMECLVCQKVVFPPVMQCKNWHLVCNNCRQTQVTCPDVDCQEEIGSATRSGVAEKFLEKYINRCKYFREDGTGCLDAFLKDDMDSMTTHETTCSLREVKCLVPSCYKSVRLSSIINHFENDHLIPKNDESFVTFNVSQMILEKQIINETVGERSCKCVPCYMRVSDDIFLSIFRISSLRSPVFEISTVIYPYYANPFTGENCLSHKCGISVVNEEQSKACYKWEGPIEQNYPLVPALCVSDERAKLKWAVRIEVLQASSDLNN